jgi:hypothetical protein
MFWMPLKPNKIKPIKIKAAPAMGSLFLDDEK